MRDSMPFLYTLFSCTPSSQTQVFKSSSTPTVFPSFGALPLSPGQPPKAVFSSLSSPAVATVCPNKSIDRLHTVRKYSLAASHFFSCYPLFINAFSSEYYFVIIFSTKKLTCCPLRRHFSVQHIYITSKCSRKFCSLFYVSFAISLGTSR
jgi:hypothetical protein